MNYDLAKVNEIVMSYVMLLIWSFLSSHLNNQFAFSWSKIKVPVKFI